MSYGSFEQWLNYSFTPCGIVYSSELAKKIFNKNNISPSEFLRPFFDFKNKEFTINLGEENIKVIKNFRIDFYDAENFHKIKKDQIPIYLYNSLANKNMMPNWNIYNFHLSKDCSEPILSQMEYYSFPWFNEYEKTFLELTNFNECEMYQQPLVNVYICSVKDITNCVNEIKCNQNPLLITEGIYEDNVSNLIILLNDKKEEESLSNNECNDIVSQFKNKYLAHQVICFDINTDEQGIEEDIWRKYIHKVDLYNDNFLLEQKRGEWISKKERENFYLFFFDFFQNFVIKDLLKLIEDLKADFLKNKKGFLSLFKKDDKYEIIQTFKIYKLTPYEKKLYLISILFFYFHDYDNTITYLKKLQSELKTKSTKHENGILLLYTICKFIKSDKKYKVNITLPYTSYIKNLDEKGALRALFILIKMQESLHHFKEITNGIKTYSKDMCNMKYFEPFLKEKASFFNMIIYQEPKFRIFTRDIMITANSYKEEEEKFIWNYHLNCLGYLFKLLSSDNSLSYIKTKLYYNEEMGRLCNNINYYEGSVVFYKRCIELAYSNIEDEKIRDEQLIKFYQNFSDAVRKEGKNDTYNNFIIPQVDITSFMVVNEEDYYIKSIFEDNNYKEEINTTKFDKYTIVLTKKKYCNLTEMDMHELYYLNHMIHPQHKSFIKCKKEFYVNEGDVLYCKFRMTNILNMDIELSNISLIIDKEDLVKAESIDIKYGPKESKEIQLKIEILKKGRFELRGIQINILPYIVNQFLFNTKRKVSQLYNYRIKKKSRTRGNTMIKHNNYRFDIKEKDNRIEVSFPESKSISIYQNELHYFPLKFFNNYSNTVKKFSIFISDNNEEKNTKFICDYLFFQDLEYQKEKNILLPLWVNEPGVYFATLLIKFEEDYLKHEFEIRRFIIKIEVIPSIAISINPTVLIQNKKESITSLNVDLVSTSCDSNKFSKVNVNKKIIYNNEIIQYKDFKEYPMIGTFNKQYFSFLIDKKESIDGPSSIMNQDILLNDLFNKAKEYSIGNINYCSQKLTELTTKEGNIIIPYSYTEEETQKEISGFYITQLTYNAPSEITSNYITNLLYHNFSFVSSIIQTDSLHYVILQLKISNLNHIKSLLKSIEISIDSNVINKAVEWQGIRSHRIDFDEITEEEIEKIRFYCCIKEKITIDLNYFIFLVKLRNEKGEKSTFKISNVPYPINISLE